MVFIDKKGRVFGKINVIDLAVLFLIIALIPIALSCCKIMGNIPRTDPDPPKKLYVRWEIQKELLPFASEVKEFDKVQPRKAYITKRTLLGDKRVLDPDPETYWAYSWEDGWSHNRAGQYTESRKPLSLKGLILRVESP